MRNSDPPQLSTWLLERLAPAHRRESLVGDLCEQLHGGRSVWWYRRQVLGTILAGLTADVAAHKLLAVRALAVGWSVMYLVSEFVSPLIQRVRLTLLSRWGPSLWGESEVLRQLWVYYGLPFVLVTCVIFVATGWIVARLHRRHLPGIVMVFAATLLIPAAFNALRIRHLLETELWPGWGWGSFRWALLFQALLSFVVYPLCALIGGLWHLRADDGHQLTGHGGGIVDES